jgi:hypothetical protein
MTQDAQLSSRNQTVNRIGLGRALEMFEDALTILDTHCDTSDARVSLPSEPLPSMLERCEKALRKGKEAASGARVLYAFPGLPHLASEWWQGRVARVTCVSVGECVPSGSSGLGLSGDAKSRLTAAKIEDLQQEFSRMGRSLLLTATAQDPGFPPLSDGRAALLVCHPMASYQACLAEGLECYFADFCENLTRFLAAHQDLPLLRCEDVGAGREGLADLCAPLQFTPADYSGQAEAFDPAEDRRTFDCSDVLGSAAYGALCAQLGYAPERAELFHRDRPVSGLPKQPLHRGEGQVALVSAFMERALALFEKLAPRGAVCPDTALIMQKLDACFERGEQDFLERFDETTDGLGPQTATLILLAAASHFSAKGQKVHGLSFVAEARHRIPSDARWLRVLVASLLFELNEKEQALTVLLEDAVLPDVPLGSGAEVLRSYLDDLGRDEKVKEHGHALLLDYLHQTPPLQNGRKPVLIEIGTTREMVPGQGSTQKLAAFCAEYGMDFITVDMDERNSRMARRMFRRHGYDFQAVTAKGEDFLAQYEGPIDYVFLDAYDFDHGFHSEVRQGRYEKFLGARIDEIQCHQMHLECAETLVAKLAPDGVICFDDTWLDENEKWTAKGTTAMPYLLGNGFDLICARNRAALLCRHSDSSR